MKNNSSGRVKIPRVLAFILSFLLIFEQSGFAQVAGDLGIPGQIAALQNYVVPDAFRPLHLRFFSYDSLNNNFQLFLDKGSLKNPSPEEIKNTTKELLNYFSVGLTLPNESFWVNLRPDGENNIIDDDLAKTDVGKVMLEADLQLKKDTARFTSPETPEGRRYWDKLYKKAGELFGSDNISIPTLTRVWIVPHEIIISENKASAYIYKATLKVMLEKDYIKDSALYSFNDEKLKTLNEYSSQLFRELIIPKLTREVNSSKRYASLRQVYYSLIMAQWFKARFARNSGNATLTRLIDRRELTGLTSKEPCSKTAYFKAYRKSVNEGEYNIRETQDAAFSFFHQTSKNYFSGGILFYANYGIPGLGRMTYDPKTDTKISSLYRAFNRAGSTFKKLFGIKINTMDKPGEWREVKIENADIEQAGVSAEASSQAIGQRLQIIKNDLRFALKQKGITIIAEGELTKLSERIYTAQSTASATGIVKVSAEGVKIPGINSLSPQALGIMGLGGLMSKEERESKINQLKEQLKFSINKGIDGQVATINKSIIGKIPLIGKREEKQRKIQQLEYLRARMARNIDACKDVEGMGPLRREISSNPLLDNNREENLTLLSKLQEQLATQIKVNAELILKFYAAGKLGLLKEQLGKIGIDIALLEKELRNLVLKDILTRLKDMGPLVKVGEGGDLEVWSHDGLDFIVKFAKDGVVFDNDVLPGYRIAENNLGGLAASIILEDVDLNLGGNIRRVEKVIIQEKADVIGRVIERLEKQGKTSEANKLKEEFIRLNQKMWARGVVDKDSNWTENYGIITNNRSPLYGKIVVIDIGALSERDSAKDEIGQNNSAYYEKSISPSFAKTEIDKYWRTAMNERMRVPFVGEWSRETEQYKIIYDGIEKGLQKIGDAVEDLGKDRSGNILTQEPAIYSDLLNIALPSLAKNPNIPPEAIPQILNNLNTAYSLVNYRKRDAFLRSISSAFSDANSLKKAALIQRLANVIKGSEGFGNEYSSEYISKILETLTTEPLGVWEAITGYIEAQGSKIKEDNYHGLYIFSLNTLPGVLKQIKGVTNYADRLKALPTAKSIDNDLLANLLPALIKNTKITSEGIPQILNNLNPVYTLVNYYRRGDFLRSVSSAFNDANSVEKAALIQRLANKLKEPEGKSINPDNSGYLNLLLNTLSPEPLGVWQAITGYVEAQDLGNMKYSSTAFEQFSKSVLPGVLKQIKKVSNYTQRLSALPTAKSIDNDLLANLLPVLVKNTNITPEAIPQVLNNLSEAYTLVNYYRRGDFLRSVSSAFNDANSVEKAALIQRLANKLKEPEGKSINPDNSGYLNLLLNTLSPEPLGVWQAITGYVEAQDLGNMKYSSTAFEQFSKSVLPGVIEQIKEIPNYANRFNALPTVKSIDNDLLANLLPVLVKNTNITPEAIPQVLNNLSEAYTLVNYYRRGDFLRSVSSAFNDANSVEKAALIQRLANKLKEPEGKSINPDNSGYLNQLLDALSPEPLGVWKAITGYVEAQDLGNMKYSSTVFEYFGRNVLPEVLKQIKGVANYADRLNALPTVKSIDNDLLANLLPVLVKNTNITPEAIPQVLNNLNMAYSLISSYQRSTFLRSIFAAFNDANSVEKAALIQRLANKLKEPEGKSIESNNSEYLNLLLEALSPEPLGVWQAITGYVEAQDLGNMKYHSSVFEQFSKNVLPEVLKQIKGVNGYGEKFASLLQIDAFKDTKNLGILPNFITIPNLENKLTLINTIILSINKIAGLKDNPQEIIKDLNEALQLVLTDTPQSKVLIDAYIGLIKGYPNSAVSVRVISIEAIAGIISLAYLMDGFKNPEEAAKFMIDTAQKARDTYTFAYLISRSCHLFDYIKSDEEKSEKFKTVTEVIRRLRDKTYKQDIIDYGLPVLKDAIHSSSDLLSFVSSLEEIAQLTGQKSRVFFENNLPGVKDLISQYGLAPFVKIIELSGEETPAVLNSRRLTENLLTMISQGKDIVLEVNDAKAKILGGQFDINNPMHYLANYLLILEQMKSSPVRREITYGEFLGIIESAKAGKADIEESTQLPSGIARELRGVVYEAHLLREKILQIQQVAQKIGRKVLVVENLSYGAVAASPITEQTNGHKYIVGTDIEVISTKVGSTESHNNEFVLAPNLFTPGQERRLLAENPIVVVIDASTSVSDPQRTSPHIPDGFKGYRNYFMALTQAAWGKLGAEDFYEEKEFLQNLKEDNNFKQLVGRLHKYGIHPMSPQGYKFYFWYPGKKELFLRVNKKKNVSAKERKLEGTDLITGPTVIFVQSAMEPEAITDQWAQDFIKGREGKYTPHTPAYFDDKDNFKQFHFTFEEGSGVVLSNKLKIAAREYYRRLATQRGEELKPLVTAAPAVEDLIPIEAVVSDLDGVLALTDEPLSQNSLKLLINLINKGKKIILVTEDLEENVNRRVVNLLSKDMRKSIVVFAGGGTNGYGFDANGDPAHFDDYNQKSRVILGMRDNIINMLQRDKSLQGQFKIDNRDGRDGRPSRISPEYRVDLYQITQMPRDKFISEAQAILARAGINAKLYKAGKTSVKIVLQHKEDALRYYLDKTGLAEERTLIIEDSARTNQIGRKLLTSFPKALSVNVGTKAKTIEQENPNIVQFGERGVDGTRILIASVTEFGGLSRRFLAPYTPGGSSLRHKSTSQIGKRAKVLKVFADNKGKRYLQVSENRNNKILKDIELNQADNIELVNVLSDLVDSVNPQYKQLLETFLEILKTSPPQLYTYPVLIKDLFGYADTEFIALYQGIANNPTALFHELGEYLIKSERLNLYFQQNNIIVSLRASAEEPFEEICAINLSQDTLQFIEKEGWKDWHSDNHYLLRALQRQILQEKDKALSAEIKITQAPSQTTPEKTVELLEEDSPKEKPATKVKPAAVIMPKQIGSPNIKENRRRLIADRLGISYEKIDSWEKDNPEKAKVIRERLEEVAERDDRAEVFLKSIDSRYVSVDKSTPEFTHLYSEAEEIVKKLLKAAELNPDNFNFYLLDTTAENAFILRYSNNIFVNIGLVKFIVENGGSKDALAFVIAHEIRHVLQWLDDVIAGKPIERTRGWLISSHADEYDADYALALIDKAGYSVKDAEFFFAKFIEEKVGSARLDLGFLTHPPTLERLKKIQRDVLRYFWLNFFNPTKYFSEESKQELGNRTRQRLFEHEALIPIKSPNPSEDIRLLMDKADTPQEYLFFLYNQAINFNLTTDVQREIKRYFLSRFADHIAKQKAYEILIDLVIADLLGKGPNKSMFRDDFERDRFSVHVKNKLGSMPLKDLIQLFSVPFLPPFMSYGYNDLSHEYIEFDDASSNYPNHFVILCFGLSERLNKLSLSGQIDMDEIMQVMKLFRQRYLEADIYERESNSRVIKDTLNGVLIPISLRLLTNNKDKAKEAEYLKIIVSYFDLLKETGYASTQFADDLCKYLKAADQAAKQFILDNWVLKEDSEARYDFFDKMLSLEFCDILPGMGKGAEADIDILFTVKAIGQENLGKWIDILSQKYNLSSPDSIKLYERALQRLSALALDSGEMIYNYAFGYITGKSYTTKSEWVIGEEGVIKPENINVRIDELGDIPKDIQPNLRTLIYFYGLGGVLSFGSESLGGLRDVLGQIKKHSDNGSWPLLKKEDVDAFYQQLITKEAKIKQRYTEKTETEKQMRWDKYILPLALYVSFDRKALDIDQYEFRGRPGRFARFLGEFGFRQIGGEYQKSKVDRGRGMNRVFLTGENVGALLQAFDYIINSDKGFEALLNEIARVLPATSYRNFALYVLLVEKFFKQECKVAINVNRMFDLGYMQNIFNNLSPQNKTKALEILAHVSSLLIRDAEMEEFNQEDLRHQLLSKLSDSEKQKILSEHALEEAGYYPYEYTELGGPLSQLDIFTGLLAENYILKDVIESKDLTFKGKLDAILKYFNKDRKSNTRDHFITLLLQKNIDKLTSQDIEKALPLLNNSNFKEKYTVLALEKKRTESPEEFSTLDGELKWVLYYFPELSPTRDDILMQIRNEKANTPSDMQKIRPYLLKAAENIREKKQTRIVFGISIFEEYMKEQNAASKTEFLLWVLGISDKKPLFIIRLEHEYNVSLNGMRDSYMKKDRGYYKNVGDTAINEFLEDLFLGDKGILYDEKVSAEFLDTLFNTLLPTQKNNVMHALYDATFRAADEDVNRKYAIISALLKNFSREKGGINEARAIRIFLESTGLIGVKIAQFLSAFDKVPVEIRKELALLKDEASPIDKEIVFDTIIKVYGSFENSPLSAILESKKAGSIKGVYRALLKKDGREVALKIKRPEIDKTTKEDLEFLRTILEDKEVVNALKRNNIKIPRQLGKRIAEMVEEEKDFSKEVDNQKRLKSGAITGTSFIKEFLSGKNSLFKQIGLITKMKDEIKNKKNAYLILRSFKKPAKQYSFEVPQAIYSKNNTLIIEDFVKGKSIDINNNDAMIAVARELIRQIFIDGFYHADPHTGNIFVSPEGNTLYFIDLGSASQISVQNRDILFDLMVALKFGWGKRVLRIMSEMAGADMKGLGQIADEIAASKEDVITKIIRIFNALEDSEAIVDPELLSIFRCFGQGESLFKAALTEEKDTSVAKVIAKPSQIGKRAKVVNVATEADGKHYLTVADAQNNKILKELELSRADNMELPAALTTLVDSVNPQFKQFLEAFLEILKTSPPEFYTYSINARDLFGYADSRLIALHKSFANNSIALFHEVAHYLIEIGALTLRLEDKTLIFYINGKYFNLPLGGEALAIAQKDPESSHYLLRALQRVIFKEGDKTLTNVIKTELMMSPIEFDTYRPYFSENLVLINQGQLIKPKPTWISLLKGTGEKIGSLLSKLADKYLEAIATMIDYINSISSKKQKNASVSLDNIIPQEDSLPLEPQTVWQYKSGTLTVQPSDVMQEGVSGVIMPKAQEKEGLKIIVAKRTLKYFQDSCRFLNLEHPLVKELQDYLDRMAKPGSPRARLLIAIDSKEPLAFSVDKVVVISLSLISMLDTKDEVVAVLAHEQGHLESNDYSREFDMRDKEWLDVESEVLSEISISRLKEANSDAVTRAKLSRVGLYQLALTDAFRKIAGAQSVQDLAHGSIGERNLNLLMQAGVQDVETNGSPTGVNIPIPLGWRLKEVSLSIRERVIEGKTDDPDFQEAVNMASWRIIFEALIKLKEIPNAKSYFELAPSARTIARENAVLKKGWYLIQHIINRVNLAGAENNLTPYQKSAIVLSLFANYYKQKHSTPDKDFRDLWDVHTFWDKDNDRLKLQIKQAIEQVSQVFLENVGEAGNFLESSWLQHKDYLDNPINPNTLDAIGTMMMQLLIYNDGFDSKTLGETYNLNDKSYLTILCPYLQQIIKYFKPVSLGGGRQEFIDKSLEEIIVRYSENFWDKHTYSQENMHLLIEDLNNANQYYSDKFFLPLSFLQELYKKNSAGFSLIQRACYPYAIRKKSTDLLDTHELINMLFGKEDTLLKNFTGILQSKNEEALLKLFLDRRTDWFVYLKELSKYSKLKRTFSEEPLLPDWILGVLKKYLISQSQETGITERQLAYGIDVIKLLPVPGIKERVKMLKEYFDSPGVTPYLEEMALSELIEIAKQLSAEGTFYLNIENRKVSRLDNLNYSDQLLDFPIYRILRDKLVAGLKAESNSAEVDKVIEQIDGYFGKLDKESGLTKANRIYSEALSLSRLVYESRYYSFGRQERKMPYSKFHTQWLEPVYAAYYQYLENNLDGFLSSARDYDGAKDIYDTLDLALLPGEKKSRIITAFVYRMIDKLPDEHLINFLTWLANVNGLRTDMLDRFFQLRINTKEQFQKAKSKVGEELKKIMDSGSKKLGGLVIADTALDMSLDEKTSIGLFQAMMESRISDKTLRERLALMWFLQVMAQGKVYGYDIALVNGKLEVVGEGRSHFVSFDEFINSLYNASAQTKRLLMVKLLLGPKGVLYNDDGKKAFKEIFREILPQGGPLAEFLKNALSASVDVLDPERLFLATSGSLLPIFLQRPPNPSSPDHSTAAEGLLPKIRDFSDMTAIFTGREMENIGRDLKKEDLEDFLLRYSHGGVYDSLAASQRLELSVNSLGIKLENTFQDTLSIAEEEQEKLSQSSTPIDVAITICQNLGPVGVRFLQVLGQYMDIPDEYQEKFRNVYDAVKGQNKFTAFDTLLEAAKTNPEVKKFVEEDLVSIDEELGGGTIVTVFAITVRNHENENPLYDSNHREVLKIRNPNAELRVHETAKKAIKIMEELRSLGQIDEVKYELSSRILLDIEEWIIGDIQDKTFLELDEKYAGAHTDYSASNGMAVRVPPALRPNNKDVKRESFVRGMTLNKLLQLKLTGKSLDQLIQDKENAKIRSSLYELMVRLLTPDKNLESEKGHLTLEEILRRATRAVIEDYARHLIQPIFTREDGEEVYLLHSDMHFGNVIISPDLGTDYVIDRNFYLQLSKADVDFIRRVMTPTPGKELGLLNYIINYFLGLQENRNNIANAGPFKNLKRKVMLSQIFFKLAFGGKKSKFASLVKAWLGLSPKPSGGREQLTTMIKILQELEARNVGIPLRIRIMFKNLLSVQAMLRDADAGTFDTYIRAAEKIYGRAASKTATAKPSQIGKAAEVISIEGATIKVKDSQGNTHTFDLSAPAKTLDIPVLRTRLEAMQDINQDHKQLISAILSLAEKSPPSLCTFSPLIEDLIGFASSKNSLIALHQDFVNNPIALLHELAEYLVQTNMLALKLEGNTLVVSINKERFNLDLEGETLAIAQKDPLNPHYLLRALQRRVLGEKDRALTQQIKEIQVSTIQAPQASQQKQQGALYSIAENILAENADRLGKEVVRRNGDHVGLLFLSPIFELPPDTVQLLLKQPKNFEDKLREKIRGYGSRKINKQALFEEIIGAAIQEIVAESSLAPEKKLTEEEVLAKNIEEFRSFLEGWKDSKAFDQAYAQWMDWANQVQSGQQRVDRLTKRNLPNIQSRLNNLKAKKDAFVAKVQALKGYRLNDAQLKQLFDAWDEFRYAAVRALILAGDPNHPDLKRRGLIANIDQNRPGRAPRLEPLITILSIMHTDADRYINDYLNERNKAVAEDKEKPAALSMGPGTPVVGQNNDEAQARLIGVFMAEGNKAINEAISSLLAAYGDREGELTRQLYAIKGDPQKVAELLKAASSKGRTINETEAYRRIEQAIAAATNKTMEQGATVDPGLPAVAAPGGIDFRSLPIVMQSVTNIKSNLKVAPMDKKVNNMDLDAEWRQIENSVSAGTIPQAEKIKQYVQASCCKGNIDRDIDKIISCISDILRLEEEQYSETHQTLKDILVVLESASSIQELNSVFIGNS